MALKFLKHTGGDADAALTPDIIGTSTSAVTLTADYADNTVTLATGVFDVLVLYAFYTPGENTREMSIQVEGSADSTNFAQKVIFKDEITGISNMLQHVAVVEGATGGTTYKRRYVIKTADNFIRVSIKEDGSANFGEAFIQASAQLTYH